VGADGVEEGRVLVLEVAPTCCYATEDFDVMVLNSWPTYTDYCFEDLKCLEELWGVVTSYWICENRR
jgi:hypothetical protein